jgi:glycosyltransferase involved in cell wall biosynthesis
MKKVLIFSLAYYPKYVGGAEVAIKEITNRISEDDMQFDMVTMRFDSLLPKEERVGNVSVYRIGFTKKNATIQDLSRFPLSLNKYFFPFLSAWKAYTLERDERYDMTWAMMANYAGFGALFFKFMFPKIPFVLTLQEGDPIAYILGRVGVLRPLFAQIFTRADRIQAISTFLASFARDMGHTKPVAVIPNAVDVKHFAPPLPEGVREEILIRLGLRPDVRYIVTVSRLVTKNAVDVVIRALTHLPKDVEFLILGIGPDEAQLRTLCDEIDVTSRVHFLGQVDHETLPSYLKLAEVFVRPSRSEGMGNAFLEAMASRVPVVATAVGGITDFLFDPALHPEHEPTGLAVAVNDPVDTARAISVYLSDAPLKERIVNAGYQMVYDHYDWEMIARDMRAQIFS